MLPKTLGPVLEGLCAFSTSLGFFILVSTQNLAHVGCDVSATFETHCSFRKQQYIP